MSDQQLKTILLVEDEGLLAMSEKRRLESAGYRVTLADSGEKAIELVCEQNVPVDLILMDIDLGSGMDGTQAAQQILAARPALPIIFISSYTNREIVEKTEAISSYGYIVKDSDPAVLLASIKMAFKLYDASLLLRESESRYRRLIENAPDIVYRFSTTRGGLYYSPVVEQVLGYSPDYLYAHPFLWNESIHPDDKGLVEQCLRSIEAGKSFNVEYRVRDGRGRWCWVNDRSIGRYIFGDEVVIEGLATDITERKLAQDVLRENEERLRVLFEEAPDAIFVGDTETGEIVGANQAACRLLDRPLEHILGMHQSQLHPPEVESYSRETFQSLIAEQAAGYAHPIFNEVVRADGTYVPVDILAQKVHIRGRKVLIGIFRDITERKQAEDRISTLLQEKEILLKEVHHRIKNNMSTIGLLLQLQADAQDDEAVKKALHDAEARVNSMTVLYDKLYRSNNFVSISIKEYFPPLLNQIMEIFPDQDPACIETCLEDIVLESRYMYPLGIILNELTTNAMKYAFAGRRDGLIRVAAERDGNAVCITFSDNGVGLPEGFKFDGTSGFGIRLVDMLVRQIRGTIRVERGRGTTFVIRFVPR